MVKGTYCLIMRLDKSREIAIGRRPPAGFPAGFYCYVGSGMSSLEKRIGRHKSVYKHLHWHIDWFLKHARIIDVKRIESPRRLECMLSQEIARLSGRVVMRKFGSSDCSCETHLHYFGRNPSGRVDAVVRKTERLLKAYHKNRKRIKERLLEFEEVWKEPDERVFEELAFCFCTPQSNAKSCFAAVRFLARSRMLLRGDQKAIGRHLRRGVRFPNNKSRYIVEARELFTDRAGRLRLKERLHHRNPLVVREWLVRSIRGLGYKEAGHFLRNIGMGENIAILDRHILRNMVRYGIISEVPKTLTRKKYLELEEALRGFSKRIGIPMAELDLLFWSMETGEVFK
jgi:N-glycosylase/DNA lyase